MANFGASFKKGRENRGLTLAQIADETRISTRFLGAIENEEFHLLPGGIFNRGFIRAYAERVGLDPDAALREYEQLVNIPEPEPHFKSTAKPAAESTGDKKLYPLAIGALALAVVIFYVFTREPKSAAPVAEQPAVTQQVVSPPPPPPPPPPSPVTDSLTRSVSAAAEPGPAPTSAITLDIEATDQTWIKVKADGTTVAPGEILERGMTRHFNADTSLNLITGNAGGLSLKLNDQAMKAIGKTGQVRAIVVTPENLKTFLE
jgi:cytoskeleton protein RodZ